MNQRHIAQSLYCIKQSLSQDKDYESFELKLSKINGEYKEDNRSSEEVIKDTFEMFKG